MIFILFRRDDNGGIARIFAGNEPRENGQLTHEGILAAMQSYNVTLNSVVEATFDPVMFGAGGIVLGVEADGTDNVIDGEHIAHVVNGIANQPTAPDFLQASHNGTNSGTFVASGKSILVSTNATSEIAGPSLADYKAESSTVAFEDISTTGTQISEFVPSTFITDKLLTSTDLNGFDFDLFGTNHTELYVNADGTITFGGASVEFQVDTDWQVTDPVRPRIAPLWGEFETFNSEPYDTYWQVKDAGLSSERLIVQWDNYNFRIDSGSGANETVTFQAVLYSNGDILFSYLDLDVTDPIDTEGRTSTVGIATDGFLYPETIPEDVFVDGAHNIPGTNNANGQKFTGVENDFVRLAWETGGAAWNNDVISGQSSAFLADFDTAFIESIAAQIADKHATNDVVFADDPLLEINIGGNAVGNYIADTDMRLGTNFLSAGTTVESTTQTILQNGNSMAGDADTLSVFQTARSTSGNGNDLVLNLPASEVPDGSYVVELMFADLDLSGVTPFMDVTFENDGSPVLMDYIIQNDFANVRVLDATPQAPEFEYVTTQLKDFDPIIKRYAVEVTDGNGLQITLSVNSNREALLNGLRILKVPTGNQLDADFDNDGDVDGQDFLSWQVGLVTSNPALGDADGDGDVDGDDLDIWIEQYAGNLQIDPDFDGDGDVDGDDLSAWETSYGVDAGGDADGDGDTDGLDFLAWQVKFHLQSGVEDWNITSAALLQLNPAVIFVSTTEDGDDGDLSLGDLSLREAIKMANGISTPVNIVLPTGRYVLNHTGTEAGDASYNDLDITGDVTIVGDGAGLTVIDADAISDRIFEVESTGDLDLSGVTLAGSGTSEYLSGLGVIVRDGALTVTDSAFVNHSTNYNGAAIRGLNADITIRRSVFTSNESAINIVGAVYSTGTGSLNVGESIFALNAATGANQYPNIRAYDTVVATSEGNNLYDNHNSAFNNFEFDGTGDYFGTPDYVVTTIEDTFDHTDDSESLSLREAIDLANADAIQREVWLPAWNFVLTRDRGTNATDTDVSYGDLDIKASLTIRGVTGVTSVAWMLGVTDSVFDLLGDFTGDGITSDDDGDVDGADFFAWQQQNGSTDGVYSADGDDDGDVDQDDLDIWTNYNGNTLDLFDVLV